MDMETSWLVRKQELIEQIKPETGNPKEVLQVYRVQFLRSQIVISSLAENYNDYGGRRTLPYVFTEQGIAMLSSVLRSQVAIQMSIRIMDTFVEIKMQALSGIFCND